MEVKTLFLDLGTPNTKLRNVRYNQVNKEKIRQFLKEQKNAQILRDRGFKPMSFIFMWGKPGEGKGELLTAKIYTPNGYKLMGDIKEGDVILDGNGKPTKVIGVYPQGIRQTYDIYFNDGTKITVDDNHLTVFYQNKVVKRHKKKGKVSIKMGKVYQVLQTKDLIEYFNTEKKKSKFRPMRVDLPIPQFKKQKVEIDAYWLGLYLGDGFTNNDKTIGFVNAEDDIVNRFNKVCKKYGANLVSRIQKYKYGVANGKNIVNILKKINIFNKKSDTKFIPQEYLYNDFETRLKMVQGLMDTDGYVERKKTRGKYICCNYNFDTTSKQLSDDFAFLVRSLGCVDTISKRKTGYKKDGVYHECKDSYRHYIKVPNGLKIVSSEKHLAKIKDKQLDEPVRKITAIKKAKKEKTQCILVDSKAHTYITDNLTPTHNTLSAKALANELGVKLLILDVGSVVNGSNTMAQIKAVFDEAHKIQDCILFLDECDSIAKDRSMGGVDDNIHIATNIIMQRLQEMADDINDRVIVFCATNMISQIDDAFMNRFQLKLEFLGSEYIIEPIRDFISNKKMFRLIEDVKEEQIHTIDIVRKKNPKKSVSNRTIQFILDGQYKKRIMEEKEFGVIGEKVDIYLSDILTDICFEMKWNMPIVSTDKAKQRLDIERKERKEKEDKEVLGKE